MIMIIYLISIYSKKYNGFTISYKNKTVLKY